MRPAGAKREGAATRHASVRWLSHPPHGAGHLHSNSRAFEGVPLSIPEGAPEDAETTPAELLAAAYSAFLATYLGQRLEHDGVPARELVVDVWWLHLPTRAASPRARSSWSSKVRGRVDGIEQHGFKGGGARRLGHLYAVAPSERRPAHGAARSARVMTTAFVLSGGASRGAMQVGMLRALYERGIAPDLLVAFPGALNAAFVATRPQTVTTANQLARAWAAMRREELFPVELRTLFSGVPEPPRPPRPRSRACAGC